MMLTEQPVNAVKTEPEYKCDSNEAYAKLLWSLLTELTKARDQFRYEGAINDICVLLWLTQRLPVARCAVTCTVLLTALLLWQERRSAFTIKRSDN
jgi:hypothetical protein